MAGTVQGRSGRSSTSSADFRSLWTATPHWVGRTTALVTPRMIHSSEISLHAWTQAITTESRAN